MTGRKKLKILKLAMELYPCPPYHGKIIKMEATRYDINNHVYVHYVQSTYWHVSEWRDQLSEIIGFEFGIYRDSKLK